MKSQANFKIAQIYSKMTISIARVDEQKRGCNNYVLSTNQEKWTTTVNELYILLRGCALGFVILLLLAICLQHRQKKSAPPFVAVLLGLAGYIIAPIIDNPAWQSLAVFLAISLPPCFFLLGTSLFLDKPLFINHKRRILCSLLVLVYFICAFLGYLLNSNSPSWFTESHWSSLCFYLSNGLKLVFILSPLLLTLLKWQNDLVNSRRQLRALLLSGSGIYMSIVVLIEIYLDGKTVSQQLELGHSVLLAIFIGTIAVWFLSFDTDTLLSSQDIKVGKNNHANCPTVATSEIAYKSISTSDSQWLSKLHHCMNEEKMYLQSELSIGDLAASVSVPEHILRRLINKHLGYRNFKDYLNEYRLEAACQKLRDPALERIPILTIAFDVGYASLTPFNRAFRANLNETPSAYRRRHLDSSQL